MLEAARLAAHFLYVLMSSLPLTTISTSLGTAFEMRGLIALDFVVVNVDTNCSLTSLGRAILPSSAFGFDRCAMATDVNSHPAGILDWRLPQLLAIGSDLVAGVTPPVLSLSPNHKRSPEHSATHDAIMSNEVERVRISEGSGRLQYWPARVSPICAYPIRGRTKSERHVFYWYQVPLDHRTGVEHSLTGYFL